MIYYEPVSELHRAEVKALVALVGADETKDALARCGYVKFMHIPPRMRDSVLEEMLADLCQ